MWIGSQKGTKDKIIYSMCTHNQSRDLGYILLFQSYEEIPQKLLAKIIVVKDRIGPNKIKDFQF